MNQQTDRYQDGFLKQSRYCWTKGLHGFSSTLSQREKLRVNLISSSITLACSITDAETTCRGVLSTDFRKNSESSARRARVASNSRGGSPGETSSLDPPASLRIRLASFYSRSCLLLFSRVIRPFW